MTIDRLPLDEAITLAAISSFATREWMQGKFDALVSEIGHDAALAKFNAEIAMFDIEAY